MTRVNSHSRATAREPVRLDHLCACSEPGLTLEADAKAQGLSLGVLYGARSALERRGLPNEPPPAAPVFNESCCTSIVGVVATRRSVYKPRWLC